MISDVRKRKHAKHYTTANWDTVNCGLCPHQCSVAPSRSGACGVRSNRDGKFYVDTYGKVAFCKVVNGFEIPLYHYAPSLSWLMVGTKGCTMRCPFCNTFEFAQLGAKNTTPMAPEDVVERAKREKAGGIVFGGNEPVVSHEFVLDVFRLARRAGLKTALQTNGTWMEDPFQEVLILTNSFTFGLKGFSNAAYSNQLGGQLDFILQNIRTAHAQNHPVEISYLIVGTDAEQIKNEFREFCNWHQKLDNQIPVILSRQRAEYLIKTEVSQELGMELFSAFQQTIPHLYYRDSEVQSHNSTFCPHCEDELITRGLTGVALHLDEQKRCASCKGAVTGIEF